MDALKIKSLLLSTYTRVQYESWFNLKNCITMILDKGMLKQELVLTNTKGEINL